MTTAEHIPSRACYLRGCKQDACRQQHLRYCKASDLRRHREGLRRIDATEVAAHLRQLIAQGWTQAGIEAATGVPDHTICALVGGIHTQVFRETADILRAFQPSSATDCPGHWTDPTGTMRRVRALTVIGYPQWLVADLIGVKHATLRHIVAGGREKVAKSTAHAVAALYSQLVSKPGPSPTARRIATARGWPGPLAWDNIDDPAAQPDLEGAGYEAPNPRRDPLRQEEIRHLAGFGLSTHEIAKRVGLPERDVHDRIAKLQAERRQQQPEAVA